MCRRFDIFQRRTPAGDLAEAPAEFPRPEEPPFQPCLLCPRGDTHGDMQIPLISVPLDRMIYLNI